MSAEQDKARGVDGKVRSPGPVYQGEAANLVAAAARETVQPAMLGRKAPVVATEVRRPLPYPEPQGINDNVEGEPAPRMTRRRLSIPRLLARIVIAPFYLVIAVASGGIHVLFIKSILGL